MPKTEEQAALTYDPELAPGYFVQTRSDFLRFPGFSPTFKLLYQVLCSYAAEGSKAWPGQETLAEHCGVTSRTIRTVIDQLVEAGLLTVTRQGLNRPNLYHIHKLPLLDRKSFPVRADRKVFPVKSGKQIRPKAETVSGELHTVETHKEELQVDQDANTVGDMPRGEPLDPQAVIEQYRRISEFKRNMGK